MNDGGFIVKDKYSTRPLRVLLTGGGTGGHIYPALALSDRLLSIKKDTKLLYVGTDRGMESKIVKDHGLSFKALEIEGFKRKITFSNIKSNLNSIRLFLKGVNKAKKIIQEFEPDIVLGTGGYVSAPVCYAASRLNIPSIIHEQNSVAGITNKFLAYWVDAVAISFEEAASQFGKNQEKIHFTGNPRAQAIASVKADGELDSYGLSKEKQTVLIFGGSSGAKRINEVFIESIEQFLGKSYQVLFVTGRLHYDYMMKKIKANYPHWDKSKQVYIEPYIEKMPELLSNVDLVVSRSGATSLAEFTALGVPSILVPSPNVTEDHQTKNAQSLVDHGAAILIPEKDLTSSTLVDQIDYVMENEGRRLDMIKHAKLLGVPNASDQLIQVMLEVIASKS